MFTVPALPAPNALADPAFLASVLDFILADETRLKTFGERAQHHPTTNAAARQAIGDAAWERDVP